MSRARILSLAACLCLLAVPARAEEQTVTMDPAATHVTFLLEATGHDVEGELFLTSGAILFDADSGAASGEVQIDATRTVSGNPKRDKTMHNKVLESATFPRITFKPRRIEGKVAPAGKSEFTLVGVVNLHGEDHEIRMPTVAEIEGGSVKAASTFSIPFVEWGLHDPSIPFLKVAKTIQVTLDARGSLSTQTGRLR